MAVETSDGFRRSQSISLWALERFFVSRPTQPLEAEQILCKGRGIYPATDPTLIIALLFPSFKSLSEKMGINLWQIAESAKQLMETMSMIFSTYRSVKGARASTPALLTTMDIPFFKGLISLSTSAIVSFFPSSTKSATMIFNSAEGTYLSISALTSSSLCLRRASKMILNPSRASCKANSLPIPAQRRPYLLRNQQQGPSYSCRTSR